MPGNETAVRFLDRQQATEDSSRAVEPRSNSVPWSLRLLLVSIVLATTSRLFVPMGMPRIVDFFHFPVVIAAFMSLRFSRLPQSAISATRWLAVLFVGGLASTISGFGFDLVRPIAGWILLAEPVLAAIVVAGGVSQSANPSHCTRVVIRTILGLAALQALFGLAQVVAGGGGDDVQGTFLDMGAGAHVASAVLFVGTVLVVAMFFFDDQRGRVLPVSLALLAAFALAAFADAKQVFVAAVPALGTLWALSVFGSRRGTPTRRARSVRMRRLVMAIAAAVLLSGTYLLYPPLQRLGDTDYVGTGAGSKIEMASVVVAEMEEQPHRFVVGLGPAATVSRFALLTEGGALRSDSPLRFLEIELAPITSRIRQLIASDYIGSSSSVWSGFASLTGLVGDLGLIGLVSYLMAWVSLARPSIAARSWEAAAALAGLAFAAVLGVIYLWWEEPGFMLLVGCLVGMGAARRELPDHAAPPGAT